MAGPNDATGAVSLVSTSADGVAGNQQSLHPVFSADGAEVSFVTFHRPSAFCAIPLRLKAPDRIPEFDMAGALYTIGDIVAAQPSRRPWAQGVRR